jgi:hypothetical protein
MENVYFVPHFPAARPQGAWLPPGANMVEGVNELTGMRYCQYHTNRMHVPHRCPAGAREFLMVADRRGTGGTVNGTPLAPGAAYEQRAENGLLPEFNVTGDWNHDIVFYDNPGV